MSKLKVAMLSKWHVHAQDYANAVLATGKAEIVAVWDEEKARGEAWAKELGASFEADLDKLLVRKDVEAVIVDTPTTMHEEVITKAAQAGKHVFTEKSLSTTTASAQRIADAVKKAGITFTISLPQRTSPTILLAKKLIDEGAFGKISLVRIRNGHDGVSGKWLPPYWFDTSKSGGGALMDLGCHPVYTSHYLLGKPKRVTAILISPFATGTDESATTLVEFANGAVAQCETSFITYSTPGAVEIYGTDATLIDQGYGVKFKSRKTQEISDEYITPKLPAGQDRPITQFIHACVNKTGTPALFSVDDGVVLTQILENSYISNQENRTIIL